MGTIRLSDVYIGQVCNGICLGLYGHARRVGKGTFSTLGRFFHFLPLPYRWAKAWLFCFLTLFSRWTKMKVKQTFIRRYCNGEV